MSVSTSHGSAHGTAGVARRVSTGGLLLWAFALASVGVLGGCAGDDDDDTSTVFQPDDDDDGDDDDDDDDDDSSVALGCEDDGDGGEICKREAKIGAAGGEVCLAGACVKIPQGALREEVTIGVASVDPAFLPALPRFRRVSAALAVTPHGQLFRKPVTVEIPHTGDAESVVLARLADEEIEEGEEWAGIVTPPPSERVVSVSVVTFSVIAAFEPPVGYCDEDRDQDNANVCRDCNDNNPLIYAGAPEFAEDGEDRNCDGYIAEAGFTDLKIEKTFTLDAPASGGAQSTKGTYRLLVTNNGPDNAIDVEVDEIMPEEGLEFLGVVSQSDGTFYDPDTKRWLIPDLARADLVELKLSVKVLESRRTITNTATIAKATPEEDTDVTNNTASAAVCIPSCEGRECGDDGCGGQCGSVCDDGDPCSDDACSPAGQCVATAKAEGARCDDGSFCTVSDECNNGVCAGAARDCSAVGDECNVGVCNEATDACEQDAVPRNGNACTDDGNACTTDVCVGGTCEHENVDDGLECSDGDLCTQFDQCFAGECVGAQRDCSESSTECGDGVCDPGSGECVTANTQDGVVTDGRSCAADDEQCTADVCQAGQCTHPNRPDNSACEDGLFCTDGDVCILGSCESGAEVDCSPVGDACNLGVCDEELGACVKSPDPEANGNACPDEGNDCTVDTCNAGTCEHNAKQNGVDCSNGDFCIVAETCNEGICEGGEDRDCAGVADDCNVGVCSSALKECVKDPVPRENSTCTDDGEQCTGDICRSGECKHIAVQDGTDCTDGLFCTLGDACSAGKCLPTSTFSCASLDAECRVGVCEEGDIGPECVQVDKPTGTGCEDGSFCTVADTCAAGVCVAGPARDCSAQTGACGVGECNELADACVVNPAGFDGQACPDEGNPCTVDTCGGGECLHKGAPLEGQTCVSGLFCQVNETCASGQCVGAPRDCSAFDGECVAGACNEATDKCFANAVPKNGAACTDDGNPCTADACAAGQCEHAAKADGTACDLGDLFCFRENVCGGGECLAGKKYECPEVANECTVGVCNEFLSECEADKTTLNGADCTDDGNPCTVDSCFNGTCTHELLEVGTSCEKDGNECTVGSCNAGGTCVETNVANQTPCLTDGNDCTLDVCVSGACTHPVREDGSACTDDGDACSQDVCVAGTCSHPPLENDCGEFECGDSPSGCFECGTCEAAASPCIANFCVAMCGDESGVDANSPYAMAGYCATRVNRVPFDGLSGEAEIVWTTDTLSTTAVTGEVLATRLLFEGRETYFAIFARGANLEVLSLEAASEGSYFGGLPLTDATWTSPLAVGKDGKIYGGASDGKLHAVSISGGFAWAFATGGAVRSAPLITDGLDIIFGSDDGKAYVVDFAGTKGAEVTASAAVSAGITLASVDEDGVAGVVADESGTISLVLPTGDVVDSVNVGGAVRVTPVTLLNRDGFGLYYATATSVGLLDEALDVVWTKPIVSGEAKSLAVAPDGAVYLVAGGVVYAYDAAGALVWQYGDGTSIGGVTLDAAGVVYVGEGDETGGRVAALNAVDGKVVWSVETASPVTSPVTLTDDGLIVVGLANGNVVGLRAKE